MGKAVDCSTAFLHIRVYLFCNRPFFVAAFFME
nr:MAG TPA: hypothetical protein [Bacteriophage sp.]